MARRRPCPLPLTRADAGGSPACVQSLVKNAGGGHQGPRDMGPRMKKLWTPLPNSRTSLDSASCISSYS